MSSTPNSGQATPKLSDEELKALVRERFTKTAEVFGDYAVTHRVTEAETLARMVSAKENDRAVDLACGPGTLALRFARHVRWICGLDFTPAILQRARHTAAQDGLLDKLAFAIGDAQCLPFANDLLDLAVTSYSLHHISDPARVISEMARVVRRGGRVGIIDIEVPEDPEVRALNHRIEFIRDHSHSRSLTQSEFESMFEAAGLRIIQMEHKGHPRTFEHWMHVAGWKPSDPEYKEAHALMVGSIENNGANFQPRFEPADVCQPGKAPDLYMFNPGIYIAAEKI
jgi:ubiquinone/menaquinone biosynthesis C-methylase UbiE